MWFQDYMYLANMAFFRDNFLLFKELTEDKRRTKRKAEIKYIQNTFELFSSFPVMYGF